MGWGLTRDDHGRGARWNIAGLQELAMRMVEMKLQRGQRSRRGRPSTLADGDNFGLTGWKFRYLGDLPDQVFRRPV